MDLITKNRGYRTKYVVLIAIFTMLHLGCSKSDSLDVSDCFEGRIPSDTLYRSIYEGCFNEVIWIEVISDSIGQDVSIYTPSPTNNPVPPIEYSNAIQVLINGDLEARLNEGSLLGSTIYFRIKSDNSDISELLDLCKEVNDTYKIPLLNLTHYSLDSCPHFSDNPNQF